MSGKGHDYDDGALATMAIDDTHVYFMGAGNALYRSRRSCATSASRSSARSAQGERVFGEPRKVMRKFRTLAD